MRKLKFRGYHKEDELMVYDINSIRLSHGYLEPDDYELMQFTGMHDKNGKEIYEGDYIITKHKKQPFLITWSDYLKNCGDCFNDSGPGFDFSLREKNDEIEIIGNIYENTEFLCEQKSTKKLENEDGI